MYSIGEKKFKLTNGYILVESLDEKKVLNISSKEEKDEIFDFMFGDLKDSEPESVELKSRYIYCRVEDIADNVFQVQKNSIVMVPVQVLEKLESAGNNMYLTKEQFVVSYLTKGA